MTAVRIVARIVDAPFAVLVHGHRAWRAITRARCPLCRERVPTWRTDAHHYVNHYREEQSA